VRRLLVEDIPDGAFEMDCMNHLRNVWIGNMEKELTKSLNQLLRVSLDEIDPRLRVSTSCSALFRAGWKEFCLNANYAKGHGALFGSFMKEKHPGALLLHVERASGSRQDLCTEGALPFYMNYEYYLEFLDHMLRKKIKDDKASILQLNLFVALSSEEMIALIRLLSIIHLSIVVPFRWLAGKTHELADHNWGPVSMGHVLDTLDKKLQEIQQDPKLILDETFMMSMFDEYRQKLPPFDDYWELLYKKRLMSVVARHTGARVAYLAQVRKELFHPTRQTDKDTTDQVIALGEIAVGRLLTELHNPKKATHRYLSSSNSPVCWKNVSDDVKKLLYGRKATNDEAESALGSATHEIQKAGRIDIPNAAAVSDVRRNRIFHRSTSDKEKDGMFHCFEDVLQECIMRVGMKDAPNTRVTNNEQLEEQLKVKQKKMELAKEKNMESATESYIDALYYIAMYGSDKCARDLKTVEEILKRLPSDAQRYVFLKENITIYVKGFGWDEYKHAWSKNGRSIQ